MTLNDLIKTVPEDMRDSIILINIPDEDGEFTYFPLIQVQIEQRKDYITILLDADDGR